MIVKCEANQAREIPQNYFDRHARVARAMVVPLTVNELYVVYAILFRLDQVFFSVCDDDYRSSSGQYYPSFWPAPLFSIRDGAVSEYWRLALTPEHKDHHVLIAFDEWVSNPYFYDKLTDLRKGELEVFVRYKSLIDDEAKASARR